MQGPDRTFLRDFFQQLMDEPLEPDDERYVRLYDHPEATGEDPVQLLLRGIEWTPGKSVQLFSGFRGTGKSTELRRLRKLLQDTGYVVVMIDLQDYLNLHTPIDITDFLIVLAGAFSEQASDLLGEDLGERGYWERLKEFLGRTRVDVNEVSLGTGAFGIKAALKEDPSFKALLQQKLAGHLGELVKQVRAYLADCIRQIKEQRGPEIEVVVLVDSIEKIRGTSTNAEKVHESVENLVVSHADKLRFDHLHLVYTIPPYLKVRYPGLGTLFAPGGLRVLPAVKVHHQDGSDCEPGLDVLERVVGKRGDWRRVLGERTVLDRLSRASGGHLRDLLHMLAEVLRRAQQLPVQERTIEAAVDQMRSEYLPISDKDARWLDRVHRTHSAALADGAQLPDLARFLDTHLVLCYQNGDEWYDVHPLIAEQVREQTEAAAGENGASSSAEPQEPT